MSFFYLASPYSHPNPAVMEARFLAAEALLAHLLKSKTWVYSPIVHCHTLANRHNMPTDAQFWASYNLAMLHRASGLYVFTLPGWSESKGVEKEMQWAEAMCIRTEYYTWLPDLRIMSSLSGETKMLIQAATGEKGGEAL